MRQRGSSSWIVLVLLAVGAVAWLLLGYEAVDDAAQEALDDAAAPAEAREGPTLTGREGGRAAPAVVADEGDFDIPGRVLDAKGEPVAGVRVLARRLGDAYPENDPRRWEQRAAESLERAFTGRPARGAPDEGEPAGETTSGADGTFTLRVHRRGEYRLRAVPGAPRVGTQGEWYLNERPPSVPLSLRVLDGSALRGRVVDAQDRGVAAQLTASAATTSSGGWADGPVATDPATGAFAFAAVPAGKVWLTLGVPGRLRLALRAIVAPTDQEVLIRLPASAVLLTGSVRNLAGEGLAGARVRVSLGDSSEPAPGGLEVVSVSCLAQTAPDGTYVLEGPVGGRVTLVEASAPGHLPHTSSPPLAVWAGLEVGAGKGAVLDLVLFRGGTLAGRVLDKAGGAPLAGAEIEVLPSAVDARLTRPPTLRAVSDAQGRYRIEGVPIGRSLVAVRHPTHWFEPLEVVQAQLGSGVDNTFTFGDGGFVQGGVQPGPGLIVFVEREGQVLARDLELVAGLSVKGRVVDAEGKPVAGAEVTSPGDGLGQLQWQWGLSGGLARRVLATSDGEGRFTVTGLAPRENWVLSAKRPPLVGEPSKPFRVQAGEETAEVLLRLTPGAVVVGRVVDGSGSPVEGANVNAWPQTPGVMPEGYNAISRADGTFRLEGLPAGTLGLNAWNGTGNGAQASVTNLQAGEVREGVELKLGLGVEVSGVLVDDQGRPARQKQILLQNTNGGGNTATTTDSDGVFKVSGLRAGPVRISAGDWQNNVELGTATAPATDLRLVWKEPPLLVIEGTVLDAQGRPVPLCRVSVQSAQSGQPAMMFWDANGGGQVVNGWFRRQATGKGPWTVSVSGATDGEGRALNLKPRKVPVEDPKTGPITITLEAGLAVGGTVLDPSGRGVEGVTVSCSGGSTRTDAQGAFSLGGLGEGDVKVLVRPPRPWVRPPEIAARAGTSDLVVRLRAGLPVAGTVEGADGRPVTQGWVSVSWKATPTGPAGEQGVNLGAGGRFRVEGLPEDALATVSVQVWTQEGDGSLSQGAPTRVNDVRAGTDDLRVRLAAGVVVQGAVVHADGRAYTGGGHLMAVPGTDEEGGANTTWHQIQEDGSFRLVNVPPGPLRLRVNRSDGGPAPEPLRVDAPATGVRVVLPASMPIRGRLTGAPDAASFRVWAWSTGKERRFARGSAVAADGSFTVEASGGEGSWVVAARVRGGDDRYALSEPVAAGASGVSLEVRTGRSIEGTLLDTDGSPLANASVQANGSSGWTTGAQTDAQGRFVLRGLPPGRYAVLGHAPDGSRSASQADVEDGERNLRLQVKAAGG